MLSKISRMVSASSTGVGFFAAIGEVRNSESISLYISRSFSVRREPPVCLRTARRFDMRRIFPSTALRRASVGWAVKTGWNSSFSRSSPAPAGPTSSISCLYATDRAFMGSVGAPVSTVFSRVSSTETR